MSSEKNNKTGIIIGIVAAVLLIGIIGTILLNRGGSDDTANNNGEVAIDETVEGQGPSAYFEYQYLGLTGLGHEANPPNSNAPLSAYFAVDSEVSDEQLDAFFDHTIAPMVSDAGLVSDPLRTAYFSKIYVYDAYEGLDLDYSDMQPPLAGPADTEKMAIAKSRMEAALRKTYSYEIPPLPERDEPLTSFGNGYYRVGEDISAGTYVMTVVSPDYQSLVKDASALFEVREFELEPGISYKIEPPVDDNGDEVVVDIADGDQADLGVCRLTYGTETDGNAGWLNDDTQFQAMPGSTVTVTISEPVTSFSPHLDGCGTWEFQEQA